MTPTDILAAARANPLSPVVPAREAWLKDWIGPVLAPAGAENGDYIESAIVGTDGGRAYWYCIEADRFDFGDGEDLRLDLRRPEVRDRLVRCGAPEWCQDNVAGMLGWVIGGKASGLGRSWVHVPVDTLWTWRRPEPRRVGPIVSVGSHGWSVFSLRGPETGPEGRTCADLAALRAGCVLEETDGWYIPIPGGAVGWLPKETA